MKKLVVIFALLVIGGSVFVFNRVAANTDSKGKTVILRVTSADSKEPISFDASYLFGTKNGKLTHIKQKTPFEIKADADLVNGVFQKTDGTGDLKVTVSSLEEKTETQLMSGTSDNVVIVATQPEITPKSEKLQYRLFVPSFGKE